MAEENIPWMIKGGKHSEGSGRRVLFHATGGEEGISSIGDLRVLQQAVATGSVKVSVGSCVMVNRYPGARSESYDGNNPSETTVPIAANASGATRYDMVIARIDDWNYAGQQATPDPLPTDAVKAFKLTVVTGVSASAKTARELNLNYPAIALARIAIPAATSAITQAMITDLREQCQPRRKRDFRVVNQKPGRDNSLTVTATAGEQFPNDGAFTVEVPVWATQVSVLHTLGSVFAPAGTVYGLIWFRFGHGRGDVIVSESSLIDLSSLVRGDHSRVHAINGAVIAIPAAMRGQSVTVLLMGRKMGGTQNLKADYATSMSLDMEFLEAPTEDV
jgi:hypothetical protein